MSEWISDYTPSVEGMRETYRETWFYAPHTNKEKEKDAEFDRFLELVYQVERERIIELLHEELAPGFAKAFVIGLIIGEQFPHVRAEIGHLSPETSIKRADSACPCGCKEETNE